MSSRSLSVDFLKLTMACMVVGLHAHFLSDFTSMGEYLTVDGLFRIAVPTFLLINGYYFFGVTGTDAQYAWIKRLVILYVFWMLAYAYIWMPPPPLSFAWFKKVFLIAFFGYFHLWYIAGLIGATLVFLVFQKRPTWMLLSSAAATFLAGVAIQYAANYHLISNPSAHAFFSQHWAHRNWLFFSYPFFCVGYLIRKYAIQQRISLTHLVLLSLAGLMALIAESYFNYTQENRLGEFDNYFSLMLICPILFLLCLKIEIHGENKSLALYSSSIYFVHIFFLVFLGTLTHAWLGQTPLTGVVIAMSVIASFFVIKLNKQLKFIL